MTGVLASHSVPYSFQDKDGDAPWESYGELDRLIPLGSSTSDIPEQSRPYRSDPMLMEKKMKTIIPMILSSKNSFGWEV